MRLELTYLGTYWEWSGDLFYMTHPDGREARVYVDSVGETWVDVRVVPEGGFFHSECVEAGQALNGATGAEATLRGRSFAKKQIAPFSWRVRERNTEPAFRAGEGSEQ